MVSLTTTRGLLILTFQTTLAPETNTIVAFQTRQQSEDGCQDQGFVFHPRLSGFPGLAESRRPSAQVRV